MAINALQLVEREKAEVSMAANPSKVNYLKTGQQSTMGQAVK